MRKLDYVIKCILVAMVVVLICMLFFAIYGITEGDTLDEYYRQYVQTKNVNKYEELVEQLDKLEIDYVVTKDKVSSKYIEYDCYDGGEVAINENDMTTIFSVIENGLTPNENIEITSESGIKCLEYLYDSDDNSKGNFRVILYEDGSCIKERLDLWCVVLSLVIVEVVLLIFLFIYVIIFRNIRI